MERIFLGYGTDVVTLADADDLKRTCVRKQYPFTRAIPHLVLPTKKTLAFVRCVFNSFNSHEKQALVNMKNFF